jgi:hypothetical protein
MLRRRSRSGKIAVLEVAGDGQTGRHHGGTTIQPVLVGKLAAAAVILAHGASTVGPYCMRMAGLRELSAAPPRKNPDDAFGPTVSNSSVL